MAFDVITAVYLFVGMMFYIPNNLAYAPQEMFIQYSALAFLALSFIFPQKRQIRSMWLGVFFLYAVINTILFNFDIEARKTLLNLFLGLMTLKVIGERITFNYRIYGKALLAFCIMNLSFLALQTYQLDPVFSSAAPQNMIQIDMVGTMGIKYGLGVVACFSLPFLFTMNPIWIIAVIPLVYLGHSSSCMLAFFVGLSMLLWFKNKKAFMCFIALAVPALLWYVIKHDAPTGMFSKRFFVWLAGITLWKDQLWFGYGLGDWVTRNFTTIQANGIPEKWMWAHNEYVQAGLELGLIGVALIAVYVKSLFSMDFAKKDPVPLVALVMLLIISFFHFPFHVGRFAGISVFILALVEAQRSRYVS